MKNERVCYHEIDIPPGLLIVGDAVQRHNAIYGQASEKQRHLLTYFINMFKWHNDPHETMCRALQLRLKELYYSTNGFPG